MMMPEFEQTNANDNDPLSLLLQDDKNEEDDEEVDSDE